MSYKGYMGPREFARAAQILTDSSTNGHGFAAYCRATPQKLGYVRRSGIRVIRVIRGQNPSQAANKFGYSIAVQRNAEQRREKELLCESLRRCVKPKSGNSETTDDTDDTDGNGLRRSRKPLSQPPAG